MMYLNILGNTSVPYTDALLVYVVSKESLPQEDVYIIVVGGKYCGEDNSQS